MRRELFLACKSMVMVEASTVKARTRKLTARERPRKKASPFRTDMKGTLFRKGGTIALEETFWLSKNFPPSS
jgi:hypothetical protein